MSAAGGHDSPEGTVPLGDLSLGTLIALVGRLRETETPDQFLCREIELDEAYLQADVEFRLAHDEEAEPEALEEATLIRELVINAHDFLGESNISAAVHELNRVIAHKDGI
jgi:hypothetical protein